MALKKKPPDKDSFNVWNFRISISKPHGQNVDLTNGISLMSDAHITPLLWTQEGFQEDEWTYADNEEALAGNRLVILPLNVFLALDASNRDAAVDRLGVLLQPGEQLDEVVPFLDRLAMIVLAFPAYGDGRSYSKAQLLRSRHAYHGTIRATGDVLIDQIPLMLRTGFDTFEVTNSTAIKRLEENRVGGIRYHYQPTQNPTENGAQAYSWRRMRQA